MLNAAKVAGNSEENLNQYGYVFRSIEEYLLTSVFLQNYILLL